MIKYIILGALLLFPVSLFTHQPVMDMAPRWEDGYGFQARYEVQDKTTLFQGSDKLSNPLGLKSNTSTLWLEGIYTFTRERRVSVKIPYVSKTKIRATSSTSTEKLQNSGLGDIIVGLLNKWYFNKPGLTGNVSLTPSIKLPTGKQEGNISIGTGTVDMGLSLSASVEAFNFYGLWDLFTWFHSTQNNEVQKGPIIGFDSDWGIHPYHNMMKNMGVFAMISLNARHYDSDKRSGNLESNTGGQTIEVAPTLVWYKDNVMIRGQYHIPVYNNLRGTQLAASSGFQLGLGITFD
jgi:hypothetical protein